jgi:hypothetical protein
MKATFTKQQLAHIAMKEAMAKLREAEAALEYVRKHRDLELTIANRAIDAYKEACHEANMGITGHKVKAKGLRLRRNTGSLNQRP